MTWKTKLFKIPCFEPPRFQTGTRRVTVAIVLCLKQETSFIFTIPIWQKQSTEKSPRDTYLLVLIQKVFFKAMQFVKQSLWALPVQLILSALVELLDLLVWHNRVLSTLELKAPHSTERLTLDTDQPYVFTFLPIVTQIFK